MKPINRILLSIVSLTLFAIGSWLFVSEYSRSQPESSGVQKKEQLRVIKLQLKWLHQAQFAGFYVAAEKGFYAKRGLKVEIVEGGPGNNAMTAVLAGTADVGVWAPEQALLARSEGRDVRAIGVDYVQSPACWMVNSDGPIHSFKDVKRQVIGTQAPGTDFDILYQATLKKQGIDRKQFVERQVDYDLSQFISGNVAVWPSYVTNEPFTVESRGMSVRCFMPADSGVDFYGDVILTTDSILASREEDIRNVMWATQEGWDYALSHVDEAVDITLKQNGALNRASQEHMLQSSVSLIKPPAQNELLRMDHERWSGMEQMLFDLGVLGRHVDVGKVYTNALLRIQQ